MDVALILFFSVLLLICLPLLIWCLLPSSGASRSALKAGACEAALRSS
jgi:hypothetical protein